MIIGICRTGGHERSHRTGLGNALLKHLPVFFLAVIQEHTLVIGLVLLPLAGVDANLPYDGFHAEGSRLVGNNGDDEFANLWVFQKVPQNADEAHCSRNTAVF